MAVAVLLVISVKVATIVEIIMARAAGESAENTENWAPNHAERPDTFQKR